MAAIRSPKADEQGSAVPLPVQGVRQVHRAVVGEHRHVAGGQGGEVHPPVVALESNHILGFSIIRVYYVEIIIE